MRTGPLDQGDWNYQRGLGWIVRRRFVLAERLIPEWSSRLLELGYGGGVFMPLLTRRATELHGVDVHDKADQVGAQLERHGVRADLVQGSISALPYRDESFDCVVGVSCLEFVDSIEETCEELVRVLAPGGTIVVVTPGCSPILDLGLRLMTGEWAEDTFQGRRQVVLPALRRRFATRLERRFPPVPSLWFYTAFAAQRARR